MGSTEGPAASLRPEARLLLATSGGPDQDPVIRELAGGPINWALFLQLTALERAEAIVAARFARLSLGPPEEVGRQLKTLALRSDLRMATVSRRLDQTLAAMAAADIPVLLLKGAALGRSVYGSLPRRPMLDIDLLVSAERAGEARSVALATGWIPGDFGRADEYYDDHFHLPPLVDGSGVGFNLELHTGLFLPGHPFSWPLEDLWTRSRPLAGGPGRVLGPEDLLLHTLLHFSWSHMARVGPWRTFRDLHTVAASGTVDWDTFTRLATASGGAPAAYWTLRLARAFGVTEVPAEVEAALRPRLAKPLCTMLERHFAGQWYLLDAPCPSVRLERSLWQLAMGPLGRVRDRTMPWAKGPVFPELWTTPVAGIASGKLLRHLASLGSYVRYFRRVVLGTRPGASAAKGLKP